ncbi:nucleoside deaminase [Caminibacter pacificus]|uniref:Nucleoside deaminase n=1 Tax=Caminibacter pacificus TaxID=1424653 RepID=A0AAJ4RDR5_9BACT|nr:nucleoside deaminase [Caminibacter pacificus]NPA87199.1 nucleoside deaminase [Campylobacterota bacterium]QCI28384.1 nucleoside deaminase [Caminibacter pacificus]ROR40892.1 tRNA(Arg) A34 adenosine deaminase TadA [Caminibacter pacificus]
MDFMKEAVYEAKKGVLNKEGGPFGAVIVKNGKIIGKGHNQVVKLKDPTAHAEIQAIRDACKNIGSFDLSGCEMYITCEPCPMCFGAIHWARIERVYFAATREDAANIGFDDKFIWDVIEGKREDNVLFKHTPSKEALEVMKLWESMEDKTLY